MNAKAKRSKREKRRKKRTSKKEFQTPKKMFTFVFAFVRCQWPLILRFHNFDFRSRTRKSLNTAVVGYATLHRTRSFPSGSGEKYQSNFSWVTSCMDAGFHTGFWSLSTNTTTVKSRNTQCKELLHDFLHNSMWAIF